MPGKSMQTILPEDMMVFLVQQCVITTAVQIGVGRGVDTCRLANQCCHPQEILSAECARPC